MSYVQKYPLEKALEKIEQHDLLPTGVVNLGEVFYPKGHGKLYSLVERDSHLSVIVSYTMKRVKGDKYVCNQFDFPLSVLSWFPKALHEFRKPPVEGGLHAGAMTTQDVDVDGEMLCIQSTTSGYSLINRSRNENEEEEWYEPIEIFLDYDLLYDHGLLALWESLGQKYERGEL